MIEAAAIPETLFTVWTNLFERVYAAPGETVLDLGVGEHILNWKLILRGNIAAPCLQAVKA